MNFAHLHAFFAAQAEEEAAQLRGDFSLTRDDEPHPILLAAAPEPIVGEEPE